MKRVLITGAAGGMGVVCSEQALAEGCEVILADMENLALSELVRKLESKGGNVEACRFDITNVQSLDSLVNQVSSGGGLDAVIHTVGVSPQMADWKKIIEVNLVGAANLLEKLRPVLNTGSAIVCISSMSAYLCPPNDEIVSLLSKPLAKDLLDQISRIEDNPLADSGLAYAFSKQALKNYIAECAADLGHDEIRVVSISPGIIATDTGLLELENNPYCDAIQERIALNRLGRAEDIVNMALFLISDKAAYITGCDILVDGGLVASLTSK